MIWIYTLAVYLGLGLISAFGIWVAREDRRMEPLEWLIAIAAWPFLFVLVWLYFRQVGHREFLRENLWTKKKLFVKVYLSILAAYILIRFIVESLG